MENVPENPVVMINVKCPDCNTVMVFNPEQSAWTEANDLVVVPLKCPHCNYWFGVQLKIKC